METSLAVLPTAKDLALDLILPFITVAKDQSLVVQRNLAIAPMPGTAEILWNRCLQKDPFEQLDPSWTTTCFQHAVRQLILPAEADPTFLKVLQVAIETFNTLIQRTNSILPEGRQHRVQDLLIDLTEERRLASQPPSGDAALDTVLDLSSLDYEQPLKPNPPSDGSGPASTPTSSDSPKSPSPVQETATATAAGASKKKKPHRRHRRQGHGSGTPPAAAKVSVPIAPAITVAVSS